MCLIRNLMNTRANHQMSKVNIIKINENFVYDSDCDSVIFMLI